MWVGRKFVVGAMTKMTDTADVPSFFPPARWFAPTAVLSGALLLMLGAGYAHAAEFEQNPAQTAEIIATKASAEPIKAPKTHLKVMVSGFDAQKGDVLVALFNSEKAYRKDDPLQSAIIPVNAAEVEVSFDDLAPGIYAFKLFHDSNRNGKIDLGPMGIPKERYFFSNNAKDLFSEPEWGESRFRMGEGYFEYTVALK